MDIGAAIIIKNEEKMLEQLLDQLSSICSQIVITDTGSEDRSPVLASKFGAEVYFYDWKDDFASARNFALDHMRTEWILSIDADELLAIKTLEQASQLFNDPSIGALNVNIKNYLDDSISIHQYPRIFRNRKEIRFSGRIHEQISKSIRQAGFEIADSPVVIEHSGYYEINLQKQERNKKLLIQELEENPDDDYIKYHLANTEFILGNKEVSYELFDEVMDSYNLSPKQKQMTRIRMAQIKFADDDYFKAEDLIDFSGNDNDIEGLRQFIAAGIEMQKYNFEKALEKYKNIRLIHSNLVNYDIVEETIQTLEKKLYKE